MEWRSINIGHMCNATFTRDPGCKPEEKFCYIDISGIDRDKKKITAIATLVGHEAPSRARKIVKTGDVLVSTVRPNLNTVAMVPPELDGEIASTGFCVLRPKPKALNGRYLFFYAQHPDFVAQLMACVRGANYPAVTDRVVKEANIPIPPPSEQRRIVEILDQADALRKKRAEADKLADRILTALFYKMFGDPATNPKGWDVVPGKKIFSKIGYGVGSPPPFAETGTPFLRAKNIKPAGINRDSLVFFDPAHEKSIARSRVNAGDVAIVRRGAYTGDCAVITEEYGGAYVGYDLICRPDKATNGHWFAAAWNYPTIWQRIDSLRSRAAQQGLNKEQISAFELPRPPKPMQDEFAGRVQELRILSSNRTASGENLEALFATLLHRAFTGELTAKWREAHMKELLQEMEQQAKVLKGTDV